MSLVTDFALLKRAGGRSKAQAQAQELYDAQKILEVMVEESTCSICYEPLRSMHVAHCGHSHCTQCIRKQFREKGERRSVPRDSFDREPEIKIYAQCPTCRVEIELGVNENNILCVPVTIAAEKQLAYLRKWSQWRRSQDDELLALGVPLSDTACPWRRLAFATEAGYKTRSEEEAEDETQWLTDEESEEDESELEESQPRAREDARRAPTPGINTVAYGHRFPEGRPPALWPMAPSPASSGWGQDVAQSIPTTGMASSPAEAPYGPFGFSPMAQSPFPGAWPASASSYFVPNIPPVQIVYHHPPPHRRRDTSSEEENLAGAVNGERG
ncbi:hypothetical protein LZ30DRAFT_722579 [Colletotrichum cereale]|nr:hypothetical protein LZ30DRAFT_722579 [Colletotrichum cereale]